MPVCHCVTLSMLEFTNNLSTSILMIPVFPKPANVLKMLSRFPSLLMIILAVLTSKILLGVKTGEKLIKIANQFLQFLPIAKYSLDLRVHKIKRITTLKRTMTRGNVLACTTIFLNAAVFCENLLLLIVSIFFLLYVTIIHTIHSVKIHKSGFNRSVHFLIINIDVKS